MVVRGTFPNGGSVIQTRRQSKWNQCPQNTLRSKSGVAECEKRRCAGRLEEGRVRRNRRQEQTRHQDTIDRVVLLIDLYNTVGALPLKRASTKPMMGYSLHM